MRQHISADNTAALCRYLQERNLHSQEENLCVREKKTNSKKLVTLKKGSSVTVSSISGKWGKAKVNAKSGCVYLPYFTYSKKTSSTTSQSPAPSSYKAGSYLTKTSIPIRKGPGKTYKKIGTLAKGKKVTVKTIKNQIWSFYSSGSLTGYFSLLNTSCLSIASQNKTSAVETTAGDETTSTTEQETTSTEIPSEESSQSEVETVSSQDASDTQEVVPQESTSSQDNDETSPSSSQNEESMTNTAESSAAETPTTEETSTPSETTDLASDCFKDKSWQVSHMGLHAAGMTKKDDGNTLSAFQGAINRGYKLIECDVSLSEDTYICHHYNLNGSCDFSDYLALFKQERD